MGFKMKRLSTTLVLTTALATVAGGAVMAQSAGDWTVGVGIGYLEPKSDNGDLANMDATIGDDPRPLFTAEYFVMDNVGVALLAATPFEHDSSLNGNKIGTTRHLPPTLSLNYHFDTNSAWKPYAGIGVNYTTFFEEESSLGSLRLDDSWGLAVQAGVDYQITEKGAVRLNVRWFDIDSDAKLNGADIGTAEIDPVLVGMSYVHKF
jgi:outer membrane protein